MATPISFAEFFKLNDQLVETGIIALDIVLGGGFFKGDVVEFSSLSGAGKSTIMMAVVANLVARGIKCAYLDVEKGVKPSMLTNMGLAAVASSTVGDPFLFLSPSTYNDLDEILKPVMATEAGYGLVVVDSITAIQIAKLAKMSVEEIENQKGIEARYQSCFMKKYKPMCRSTGVTMWMINQMRTDIDMKGGNTQEDSAGGLASKFYPDVRLRMQPGPVMKKLESTAMGEKDVIYGNEAWLYTKKNRGERSEIKLPIPVIYGRGVSNVLTMQKILTERGMITGGGGGFFTITFTGDPVKCRGEEAVTKWVRENSAAIKTYMKERGWLKLTAPVGEG